MDRYLIENRRFFNFCSFFKIFTLCVKDRFLRCRNGMKMHNFMIFTFDFLLKFYKSKFQFKIKKKTVDKQFGTGYNKNDDFLSEFVPNT